MTLMPIPCPHVQCGVTLSVHACTPNGEQARCGACRGRVAFEGGALRAISLFEDAYEALDAFRRSVAQAVHLLIVAVRQRLSSLRPVPSEHVPQSQPCTLHLALSTPARLSLPTLDRRPLRSPATRRR
ncbi:hypothetical protein GO986_17930 [Deinococcus sp. HMF7620]|uniref:Uncharacterized protein n=1 Tax=Deinococcus arboris TaxID=2682977 RepID=A0A7C9LN14_9DEIO|nr:hypothetical protein [Deinococcus arboris]MVN88618.1 hypothetical protein [Deinococcus arboris]